MQKVLKTLRLCIDLGNRRVETNARSFEKCVDLLIEFSTKMDEKSSSKAIKNVLTRKIDNKSFPGVPFGAKGRFLVDFRNPAGPSWVPKYASGRARDASNSL